jgi:hypothetical protein
MKKNGKRIAILSALIFCGLSAWGLDNSAVDSFDFCTGTKPAKRIATAIVNRDMGIWSMKIAKANRNYTKVRVYVSGDDSTWYKVDGNGALAGTDTPRATYVENATYSILPNTKASIDDTCNLTLLNKKKVYYATRGTTGMDSALALGSDKFFTLINIQDAMTHSTDGTLSVSICLYYSGGSDNYVFTWTPEYFKGERDDTYYSMEKEALLPYRLSPSAYAEK